MSASSSQLQSTAGSLQVGGNLSVLGAQSSSFTGAVFTGPVVCEAPTPATALTVTTNTTMGGTLDVAGSFSEGPGSDVVISTSFAGGPSTIQMFNPNSSITVGPGSNGGFCRLSGYEIENQFISTGGIIRSSFGVIAGQSLGTFNNPWLPDSTGGRIVPPGGFVPTSGCFLCAVVNPGQLTLMQVLTGLARANSIVTVSACIPRQVTVGGGLCIANVIAVVDGSFTVAVFSLTTLAAQVPVMWTITNAETSDAGPT